MITKTYIRGCLDSRGMPTDKKTVERAFKEWRRILESYEDDYFTTAMYDIGIKANDEYFVKES